MTYAQYHPRCDCSFQGGDKRQYHACDAEVTIRERESNASIFNEYVLDFTTNTGQCTQVHYRVYPNEGQEAFGGNRADQKSVNVVDGSHTIVLTANEYKTMPQLDIKRCILCEDKNYQGGENSTKNTRNTGVPSEIMRAASEFREGLTHDINLMEQISQIRQSGSVESIKAQMRALHQQFNSKTISRDSYDRQLSVLKQTGADALRAQQLQIDNLNEREKLSESWWAENKSKLDQAAENCKSGAYSGEVCRMIGE